MDLLVLKEVEVGDIFSGPCSNANKTEKLTGKTGMPREQKLKGGTN